MDLHGKQVEVESDVIEGMGKGSQEGELGLS